MSTFAESNPPQRPNRPPAFPTPTRGARADERPHESRHAPPRSVLRVVPSLAHLDDATLDRLADRCDTLDLSQGRTLFREGDECAGVYVVAEGEVRVFRRGRDGAEETLRVVGWGRTLGELSLARGERHQATAVTAEPSRVLFLSRQAVEALYRAEPDVAHSLIDSLARRLRDAEFRARALAFRDVLPRLAVLLAGYAERGGTRSPDGAVLLELGRTQEEIAHEIGAARESVSRAWGQLRDQGLIEPRRGHRVRIPDVHELRAVAGA
jgi:CRP-like cAMP-binding protein